MTATVTARTTRSTRPSRAATQPITAAFVPDALLTWTTFMALTGSSESTLRRLRVTDPSFPRLYRLAGCARFKAADVRAWLAAQPLADTPQSARPPLPAATTPATP